MERPHQNKKQPKAVVLARFSALGDVAMTVPVVYDLCYSRPDLRVVMVTRGWMGRMMVNAPDNLVVVSADLDGRHKGPRGMYRLVQELRRDYDVEAFVDLHDVLRTRMMRTFFKLGGVPTVHIDKGRAAKRALVKAGAEAYGQPLPTTDSRYRSAIAAAGYDVERQVFASLYPATPTVGDGILRVGIAPFAAHPGKVYPLEKMAQVVEMLAARPDTEIYLFGAGTAECTVLQSWAEGCTNIVNMAARKAGLAAELEIMSRLDVMVAMDSGNMHLAAIARTPRVVSVWGATHPYSGFMPFGADAADMLGADIPCRPCSVYGNKPCRYGDMRCMAAITPQQLYNSICNGRSV